MGNAETILVVILSSFLAIFLVLGIIFWIISIKIVRSVKRITDDAERMVHKAEVFGEFLSYASTPMNIARIFADIANRTFKPKSEKNGRK